jgi:hypothetical protein
MAALPAPTIFGIRHHGPGSARSLCRALHEMQPDAILVEGPPDAEGVLPLLTYADMQPPVALLIYVPDQPQHFTFYPFAVFSPEWQALHYGLSKGIPVRFMDLPQAHRLGRDEPEPAAETEPGEDLPQPEEDAREAPEGAADEPDLPPLDGEMNPAEDPLGALAQVAGYSDGERWWEHMVEHRQDGTDLFAAILEAMTALREELPPSDDPLQEQREAAMRQAIRAAQKEGFQRIAVVCGAWHAPALAHMPPEKDDKARLKGLPKVKTQATWVPWTYNRLSYYSGYGAGIESPGWYHHLWTHADSVIIRWMTRVARLLRGEDLDASSAHVIEAVRLAEALAALRGHPLPGLPELNEATQTVFCFGSDVQMGLIAEQLIISDTMGAVPTATPTIPLQRDLEREQKRLRLPAGKTYGHNSPLQLDLRKPNDLGRSHLLHRLNLLGIPWGETIRTSGRKKGTFHEDWLVQWQPEYAINLIEVSIWGNTVRDAASAIACYHADHAPDLPTLTDLVSRVLLADLPDAIGHLMHRLQAEAALASDVAHLMEALPPLANVLRYGSVRKIDASMVGHVVDGLVVRVCVGLPLACASLDDEAAAAMFRRIIAFHGAVALLQNDEHRTAWHAVLQRMTDLPNVHGLISGRCCRLLLDGQAMSANETARRMGLALSRASDPPQAAAWIEGFLAGSGLVLLHDDMLWNVLDSWLMSLNSETFTALLPLLRRTFATFSTPERRQMGERVREGSSTTPASGSPVLEQDGADVDRQRAEEVLPLLATLLGVSPAPQE